MTDRLDRSTRQDYYGNGRQPWDDILAAGYGPQFAAGSILKYMRRLKGERAKDIEKARWYWARLMEMGPTYQGTLQARLWVGNVLTRAEYELLTFVTEGDGA